MRYDHTIRLLSYPGLYIAFYLYISLWNTYLGNFEYSFTKTALKFQKLF